LTIEIYLELALLFFGIYLELALLSFGIYLELALLSFGIYLELVLKQISNPHINTSSHLERSEIPRAERFGKHITTFEKQKNIEHRHRQLFTYFCFSEFYKSYYEKSKSRHHRFRDARADHLFGYSQYQCPGAHAAIYP
jgi:hypothetical protein